MLLKKIVIAEDDDAIAHMINMTLGDAGFLCLRASDGEEALNLVRLHTPDLLVLDVMMPRMDGREVARRLKGDVLLSRTPILMLTALGSVDDKVDGIDSGADAYMTKPFDLRELSAHVKALIRATTRERDRNPTTNLPGPGAVEEHIAGVLKAGTGAAVVHFDIRAFDAYLDQVGFSHAESLVASMGQLVLEKVRSHSPDQPFLGHLGGSDFIAVVSHTCAEELARDTIARFTEVQTDWDLRAEKSAPLQMVIGIAKTDGLGSKDGSEIARRLAAALKGAKEHSGSNYVIWKS